MCKWRSVGTALYGLGNGHQLELPSLTLLSVAGCGRLHLRAAHWVTSVALLQVVDNLPHEQW